MYSSRIQSFNDVPVEEEESDWVRFPCSPFDDESPRDQIKQCKTKKNVGITTVVPHQCFYNQHVEAVEMIYGYPPDCKSPEISVPKHKKSPTSTIINTPLVGQEILGVASRFDQPSPISSLPPRTKLLTTDPIEIPFAAVEQGIYLKDEEQVEFPSPDVLLPLEDFDGGITQDSKRSHINRSVLCCSLSIGCIVLSIFVVLFLGLIIGTAIRGEPISLRSIFSPDYEEAHSDSAPPPPESSSISSNSSNSPSLIPSIIDHFLSGSPTTAPTFEDRPKSNLTVGAYYYPWHGDDFHNGQGYLRKKLNQGPTLGEYNDADPNVIAQHLSWSRNANIQMWVTSWWGPNRLEDVNTRDIILTHKDLGDHQIGLLYETTGRIPAQRNFSTATVENDIEYICKTYFDHPNYYRVDGRPVLFVYLTRTLEREGKMEEVILLMRSVADFWGHDIYIVGDHAFATPPSGSETFRPFLYLDAVTSYDVYGSMRDVGYAGQDAVDAFYQEQRLWRQEARLSKCGFIPTVSPGYNDRGVRIEAGHAPLSRQLVADAEDGSFFAASLRQARYLVDEAVGNLMLVNSFNKWHEDTQIEPASGTTTNTPFNLTLGLDYTGYGELYLNLLSEATVDD